MKDVWKISKIIFHYLPLKFWVGMEPRVRDIADLECKEILLGNVDVNEILL